MWLGALSKSRILSRTLTLVQGSFFCDLVLIYFIKKSNFYRDKKYEEVRSVMLLPSGPRGAPRPLYWFSVGLCGERGRMTKSSLGRAGDSGMFCYLLSRTGFCFTGRGHHRPWAGEAVSRAGSATVSLGALDQSQACLGLSFSVKQECWFTQIVSSNL